MPSHARSLRTPSPLGLLAVSLLPMLLASTSLYAQPAPQAPPASQALQAFHIGPQPLTAALSAFGEQSGVRLAYPADLAQGLTSPGFTGRAAPLDALQALLRGTALAARFNGDGTLTLVRGSPDDAALTLPAVVASARPAENSSIVGRESLSATKTGTPLIDTPQAVSVVTRKQMDLQNVQSVPQALRYSSGVLAEQNGRNENAYETVYGRGFRLDEYLDGLRLPSISASASYNIPAIDPYLLEQIDVLHGPSSMLYGQASPGGLVNLTSKHPTDTPLHEVNIGTGSYGRVQGSFDLGGPLDSAGTWSYRLTGDAYTSGTQMDHDRNSRIAIAPALTWRPDANTRFTLLTSYTYEPDAGIYGFVPAIGTVRGTSIGKISTKTDIGDPNYDRHERSTLSIGYEFEHRFDSVWTVQQNLRFTHINSMLNQIFGLALGSDNRTLSRYAFYNHGALDQLTLDNRVRAQFSTGPVQHTMLAGIDYQRSSMDYRYGFGFNVPSIDIYAPTYSAGIATPAALTREKLEQNQVGIYVQDQMKLGRWGVVMGARGDYYDANDDVIDSAVTRQTQRAATWRSALLYHFDFGLAPYFSYSTSFQPNTSTAYGGGLLAPTTGQQYEVGVKYQPPHHESFVSLALFHLKQQNVATTDPVHPTFSVSTGEVRSEGIELEAHAALRHNWDVIGSYTYVDAINTRSNDYPGQAPVGIPRHQGALWTNYTLAGATLPGLTIGGGMRVIGPSFGSQDNSLKVPGFTLFDAMLSYELSHASPTLKGWQVQVNATNLLDKTYVTQCASATQCTFGLRRMVLANLRYRW